MTQEDAIQIQAVLEHPGWEKVVSILNEQISESKDELYHLMSSKPDTLTGKTAIRLASRAKALEEFKEAVLDCQKILAPQPKGRGK